VDDLARANLPHLHTTAALAPWVFTRHFWPQTPEHLVDALNPDALVYRVKQVHGNTVLAPADIAAGSQENPVEVSRPEADALVSDGAKQAPMGL
jgi:copper oxidase (laccase) domain-containing protein